LGEAKVTSYPALRRAERGFASSIKKKPLSFGTVSPPFFKGVYDYHFQDSCI
jgi:hypothetical protein